VIGLAQPDEVYNLAAQSHVRVSFDMPIYTVDTDALGSLKLLEAVRVFEAQSGKKVRYYQAWSSGLFGKVQEVPKRKATPPDAGHQMPESTGHDQ
jgi:GDPmannose 4,6-dehydratase